MKLANYDGRATLVFDDAVADVHDASGGRFGHEVMRVYDEWPAFVDFAAGVTTGTAPLVDASLECPVPAPRQVFAIGLNYRSHAEESGMQVPPVPVAISSRLPWLAVPVFVQLELLPIANVSKRTPASAAAATSSVTSPPALATPSDRKATSLVSAPLLVASAVAA